MKALWALRVAVIVWLGILLGSLLAAAQETELSKIVAYVIFVEVPLVIGGLILMQIWVELESEQR